MERVAVLTYDLVICKDSNDCLVIIFVFFCFMYDYSMNIYQNYDTIKCPLFVL